MQATPKIHELVREGRATPEQGARLLQLRRVLDARRQRQAMRRNHPWVARFIGTALFIFAFLGLRPND